MAEEKASAGATCYRSRGKSATVSFEYPNRTQRTIARESKSRLVGSSFFFAFFRRAAATIVAGALNHRQNVSNPPAGCATKSSGASKGSSRSFWSGRGGQLDTVVRLLTICPVVWLTTTYCPGECADSSMMRTFADFKSFAASTGVNSPPSSFLRMSYGREIICIGTPPPAQDTATQESRNQVNPSILPRVFPLPGLRNHQGQTCGRASRLAPAGR